MSKEKPLKECAIREMYEETNQVPGRIDFRGLMKFNFKNGKTEYGGLFSVDIVIERPFLMNEKANEIFFGMESKTLDILTNVIGNQRKSIQIGGPYYMNYFDHLESEKTDIIKRLDKLFELYKVEPVGNGYIDCIVMKDKLENFINELSVIGILVTDVSWWCYVNPDSAESLGCPHGMGGPKSKYYDGWFSELQNDLYEVDKKSVDSIFYDKELVSLTNLDTLKAIQDLLKKPFKYTPAEYIEGNKCVMPGLWLLVPDDWKRIIIINQSLKHM